MPRRDRRPQPVPTGIHPDKVRLIAWMVWSTVVLVALAAATAIAALLAAGLEPLRLIVLAWIVAVLLLAFLATLSVAAVRSLVLLVRWLRRDPAPAGDGSGGWVLAALWVLHRADGG